MYNDVAVNLGKLVGCMWQREVEENKQEEKPDSWEIKFGLLVTVVLVTLVGRESWVLSRLQHIRPA